MILYLLNLKGLWGTLVKIPWRQLEIMIQKKSFGSLQVALQIWANANGNGQDYSGKQGRIPVLLEPTLCN